MNIEWSNDFCLGIPVIDDQHKRLFAIINRLDSEYRGKKCIETIEKIFLELINYCNYHFTLEEKAMAKCNYDRLELHKAAHDLFVKKIHEFYVKHKKNECSALPDTINFLNDWLIDHIMVEDRHYLTAISNQFIK